MGCWPMIFPDIPAGGSVFLDANCFIYHFIAHPGLGAGCTKLLERIEIKEIQGFTSSHVLSEMAHRLMTVEAQQVFGWPAAGMANRLRRHPTEVQQLSRYRQAIDELQAIGIQ